MTDPAPPENVVIHYRSGQRRKVECVYLGWRDGKHIWQAQVEPQDPQLVDTVTIDGLPPHTTVELPLSDPL
jgi:hypothetical protein